MSGDVEVDVAKRCLALMRLRDDACDRMMYDLAIAYTQTASKILDEQFKDGGPQPRKRSGSR